MVRYFEVACFRAALETAWPRDFLQAHTSVTRSTPLWASFQERYARKEVFGEAFRSARPAITVHIFKNRSYLDSKIGTMLVRSAGERKSNSKINAAVRAGEVASCLDRVNVSLQ